MPRRTTVVLLGDDELARTARVMGPSSAAARAIEERDRRLASGEDVICFLDATHDVIVVGPDPRSTRAFADDSIEPS